MKRIHAIILGLLAASGVFISCEKVIDVDLDESPPELVVEAVLLEGSNLFTVTISRSTTYFDSSPQEVITDATVELSDDQGNTYTINHRGNGEYSDSITAVAGRTYLLSVEVEGNVYQATSHMQQEVPLVALIPEFEEETAFNDEGYALYIRFQDPAGEANYYRIVHYIDGVPQKDGEDMRVFDDDLIDGGLTRLPIFQTVFESGEFVTIDLIHFDEASFDYFNSLSDIINTGGGPGGATAAPGDPNTNWSGGILGYFSAQNVSSMSISIP